MIAVWLYSPNGTVYDLLEASDHKVSEDGLPDIEEDLQDKHGLITAGELSFTADNASGWWSLLKDTLNPKDRFDEELWASDYIPGIWYIQVRKNGMLRWEGDIVDPQQLSFDDADEAKTCTFTASGALMRFKRYNAALVRREIDEPIICTSDMAAHPKWITFEDQALATLLVPGDKLLLQKFGALLEISNHEVEIAATPVEEPTLPAGTVIIKQRLKFNVTNSASVYCATPYYRNKTAGWLVNAIMAHCNIPEAKRYIDLALENIVIPYADFKDKDCGDALEELASVIPAVAWRDDQGVHVSKLDSGLVEGQTQYWVSGNVEGDPGEQQDFRAQHTDEGPAPKALDAILMEPVRTARWSNYHSAVVVTGANKRTARRGRLTFPSTTLEIQSDFLEKMDDIKALADALWPFYAADREGVEAVVADDGTRYRFWDEVSIGGVVYRVSGYTEPALSVDTDCLSTVSLRLWEAGEAVAGDGDAEDDDEVDDTDPPPECAIEAVTRHYDDYPLIRELYPESEYPPVKTEGFSITQQGKNLYFTDIKFRLWVVIFTWNGDLRRLVDFLVTRWNPLKDRTKHRGFNNFPVITMGLQDDGKYYAPIYVKCGNERLVDVQAVYYDGQYGAETDGVPLGYPDEPNFDEPDDTGETPLAITADDISYDTYPDDIGGTAKIEASLNVTVALTPDTAHELVKVFVINSKGKQISAHAKCTDADGSVVVHFRRKFYKNEVITIQAVEVSGQKGMVTRTDDLDIILTAGTGLTLAVSASIQAGPHPLMVYFELAISSGTEPYSIVWEFGDGTISTIQNPSHQYENQGSYLVRVHVEDGKGARATDAHILITVIDVAAPGDYTWMAVFTGSTELYARESGVEPQNHQLQFLIEGTSHLAGGAIGEGGHIIEASIVGMSTLDADFLDRAPESHQINFGINGVCWFRPNWAFSLPVRIDINIVGRSDFDADFKGRDPETHQVNFDIEGASWFSPNWTENIPVRVDVSIVGKSTMDADFLGRSPEAHECNLEVVGEAWLSADMALRDGPQLDRVVGDGSFTSMDARIRVAGVTAPAAQTMKMECRGLSSTWAFLRVSLPTAGTAEFTGRTDITAGFSGRDPFAWRMEMVVVGNSWFRPDSDWTDPGVSGITVAVESKVEDAPGTRAKECYLKCTITKASAMGASHIVVHATKNGNPLTPKRIDCDGSDTSAIAWWHRCAHAGDALQVTRIALWHKHKRKLLTGGPWPATAKKAGSDETGYDAGTGLPPAPPDGDTQETASWYATVADGSLGPHSFIFTLTWADLSASQKETLWRAIYEVYDPNSSTWKRHEEVNLKKLIKEGKTSVDIKVHINKKMSSGNTGIPNTRIKLEDVFEQTNPTWWYLSGYVENLNPDINQPSPLEYYQDPNGYLTFNLLEATDGTTLFKTFASWLLATSGNIYMDKWGSWDRPPVLRKPDSATYVNLYSSYTDNVSQFYAGCCVRDATGRRFIAKVSHIKNSVSKPIPTSGEDNTWWHYWRTNSGVNAYFLDWHEYRASFLWCNKPEWRDGMLFPVVNVDGTMPTRCKLACVYSARTGSGLSTNKLAFFAAASATADDTEGENPEAAPAISQPPVPAGGGCFAPGVFVMGTTGLPLEIRSVQCNRDGADFVMGMDDRGRLVPTLVLHKFEGDAEEEMLSVAGIASSPDHLWYMGGCREPPRNALAAAGRLAAGSVLYGVRDGLDEEYPLESAPVPAGAFVPHNLNTETGNFLVSADGDQWFLVHNAKA